MKTLFTSVLAHLEIAIDFINGVDRAAFQPKTLSSVEMDAMHRTMVF
ncbi:MAG: hypothetical protein QF898_13240 [SAR202 cluster bacterium]|jgi:hypothetical protein|nr:hypothetical protein [SAR202 cluster bacterium]MDP6512684.1 hypothetical protein [SAR202 cluster bacterium]MDP6715089.1 hypothetical protein [SAR202 cluster bacterium]